MARLTRRLGLLVALLVTGVALTGCGTGGAVSLARTSCQSVHRALILQSQSEAQGISAGKQAQLQAAAMSELLKATPSAAQATSIDGSWNPLMTAINEAERIPISNLVPSLTRLCQVANSSTPYL